MPEMSKAVLQNLADRLRRLERPELAEAASLVEGAIDAAPLRVAAEEQLSVQVWELVSHARDHHEFEAQDDLIMDALEAEMAGRTLVARIHIKAST